MNALVMMRRLAANNAWSNLRLYRACAHLTRADYEAPRTSFFPSIPATLNHILTVDWYYIDALEGGGRGLAAFVEEMPFTELAALTVAQRESDMRLVTFVNGLARETELDREVRLQREDHVQVERVGDVLMHLHVHQIH